MSLDLLNSDALSISSSIISVLLAIIAIIQATIFFIASMRTKYSVEKSLAKIETETRSLTRLTGKVVQPLTDYATSDKIDVNNAVSQIVEKVAKINFAASHGLTDKENKNPRQEEVELWIVIHHYAALLNFFAKLSLPKHDEYDPADEFDVIVSNIVNGSSTDFIFFDHQIDSLTEEQELSQNAIEILKSTRDIWSFHVSTISEHYSDPPNN